MKFKLTKASYFVSSASEREQYEKLGFEFVKNNDPEFGFMWRTSKNETTVELNSLDDLLAFAKKWGDIIIQEDGDIVIYDSYRE